jgi:predicted dehydrogenase
VENEDAAQALVRFASGASGLLTCSRAAWGRKNRLAFEIHGTRGTLIFDQERMNELQLFTATGAPATRGFRTILTAPAHPPYGLFCPAPGHGLGFNDLKVIELAALLRAIDGTPDPLAVDFTAGLAIERVIHAMVMSAQSKAWVAV